MNFIKKIFRIKEENERLDRAKHFAKVFEEQNKKNNSTCSNKELPPIDKNVECANFEYVYITQQHAIFRHLKTIGPITPIEALRLYGCFRLSAIIFNLRKHNIIETEIVHNGRKRYAKYTLIKSIIIE